MWSFYIKPSQQILFVFRSLSIYLFIYFWEQEIFELLHICIDVLFVLFYFVLFLFIS